MSMNERVVAGAVALMSALVMASSHGLTSDSSMTPSPAPSVAAPSPAPSFAPPVQKIWTGYVPQLGLTVMIIWVSTEPGVAFHDEADTVFRHIVNSIRKSDVDDCLVRTILSQTTTDLVGRHRNVPKNGRRRL
jgi:hypothetical protein